jgi:hypothetical protein
MVEKLWGFEDVCPSLGMLLATECMKICPNLPKIAKICQNLPKDNFEIPPKIKILLFFKNKNYYV